MYENQAQNYDPEMKNNSYMIHLPCPAATSIAMFSL